jgi:hypothetical protein
MEVIFLVVSLGLKNRCLKIERKHSIFDKSTVIQIEDKWFSIDVICKATAKETAQLICRKRINQKSDLRSRSFHWRPYCRFPELLRMENIQSKTKLPAYPIPKFKSESMSLAPGQNFSSPDMVETAHFRSPFWWSASSHGKPGEAWEVSPPLSGFDAAECSTPPTSPFYLTQETHNFPEVRNTLTSVADEARIYVDTGLMNWMEKKTNGSHGITYREKHLSHDISRTSTIMGKQRQDATDQNMFRNLILAVLTSSLTDCWISQVMMMSLWNRLVVVIDWIELEWMLWERMMEPYE